MTTGPASAPAGACDPGAPAPAVATGTARQLITVVAPGTASTTAPIELWARAGSCWAAAGGPWAGRIGRNGLSAHHREGDGTTPTGVYGIGATIYGNAPDPGVREPYRQLTCGDWWDEDPTSVAYNTFRHVPCGAPPGFGGGSEALWTETAAYPSFAVVDYNSDPIVPGAGSAIFLHADIGAPTDGCVSLPLAALDQTLDWLDPADAPAIAIGAAG